ncbi:MAG: hypothetical protein PHV16_01950 [Candidatus Nanoarchaeia archaeon]|nr:hypothetical protein [Candidatus Nanoarchaeia archaeon]
MANLVDIFRTLENWGMLDVMLPFLLIFTLVFAVLQKAKIFGDDSKRFNVIIALVLAMVVVIPHIMGTYPRGQDAVVIINSFLPDIALVLVAIIMVLMLSGVFGYQTKDNNSGWILFIAFAVVIYLFGISAGWWVKFNWFNISSDTLTVVLVLLVFGIIIAVVTSEGGNPFKPLRDLVVRKP